MVVKEYKPRELNDGVWHRVSGNTDTMDELMRRAKDGDLDILENADVDKVYGITKITPLHMLARVVDGNELIKYIVEHPSVDKVATEKGITPLHILANRGFDGVLDHLSVARVKDWDGNTPLHLLAKAGSEKALTHSEATRVYNGQNKTPKNMFKPKD